ncbi:hypothetical protein ACFQOZ_01970 [Comamonas endophytica]|uniref:hypothetical protein n=1 Tax=Comamonas endophytica TaxID=2949090 RepID=UPI0036235E21
MGIARRGLLGALGCGALLGNAVASSPLRLRDALGREVVLPAPAQRIVTIFSSNTELVAALGLTRRIVGIEEFTRFPPRWPGCRGWAGAWAFRSMR